jgi:ABC-type multidrug transport system ATPase subunit
MKQRLGLAVALVHSPALLILDEPTNGLDPQGIAEMRALIKHLSTEHGKTILISSHLLYEIEQMATRMLIIHKGKKMAEGLVEDLLHPEDTLTEVDYTGPAEDVLRSSPYAEFISHITATTATLKMHPDKAAGLNAHLIERGVSVRGLRARHSLEAFFLSLTSEVPQASGRPAAGMSNE